MSEHPSGSQMPVHVEEPIIGEEPMIQEPVPGADQDNGEVPENEVYQMFANAQVLNMKQHTQIIKIRGEKDSQNENEDTSSDDEEDEEGDEESSGEGGTSEEDDVDIADEPGLEGGDQIEVDNADAAEAEEEDEILVEVVVDEGQAAQAAGGESADDGNEESGEDGGDDDTSGNDSDSTDIHVPNELYLRNRLALLRKTLAETAVPTSVYKARHVEPQVEFDLNQLAMVNIVNWIKKKLKGQDPSRTPLKYLLDRVKETMLVFHEIKDGGRKPMTVKTIEALFQHVYEM